VNSVQFSSGHAENLVQTTFHRQTVQAHLNCAANIRSCKQFAISQKLASHLRAHLSTWRPNLLNLVFATKNGTPWDQNLVVKRKLHPLLESLGIRRCGLHAFRHTNGSLMDRWTGSMRP
jgi:hypothetical protein